MSFGIYQIGGQAEQQTTTLTPVSINAATAGTNATDLVGANSARVALSLVNETDKICYMTTGTATANAASATNKILEIPAKQRILLSGDNCPREALNITWMEVTTGKFEAVERVRV